MNKYLTLYILLLFQIVSYGKNWTVEELPTPKFVGDKMIINPEGFISKRNIDLILTIRKTYFYPRYIEIIHVSISNITGKPTEFIEQLASKWDLEAKTMGRFLILLKINDTGKYYLTSGSQLKQFYTKKVFKTIVSNYKSKNLLGDKNGTYNYIIVGDLGNHIFTKIAFDNHLVYSFDNSIPFYPDYLVKTKNDKIEIFHYTSPNSKTDTQENKPLSYASNQPKSSESTYSISDIPNQRLIDGSYISDHYYNLSRTDYELINEKLQNIEKETGYQVAVVVINKLVNNDHFDFGLRLFNNWEIGDAKKNNGLLILVSIDDRNLTFNTGLGTELILSDIMTKNIGDHTMKPDFKKGNYGEGIIKGLTEIKSIFEGNMESYDEQYGANYEAEENNTPFYKNSFVKFYLIICAILTCFYLLALIISVFIKDLLKKYKILKVFKLLIFPIIFPIPFLIFYFINKYLMERWRNTVRFSKKTGAIMHKLDEVEEDEYLSKGQVAEETVKSIDYDVWVTKAHNDILILKYQNWFTKYHKCPSCRFKTYYKMHDITIVSASYSSSGIGEKKYQCENCNHIEIKTYTIPRLTRSSNSKGSSWSSGGGYSGGGGSSWGGGSSGGGGSSSGW